jgi:hypothetical protein
VNPLTGQILNAGITVDANMTRFTKMEFQRFVDPLSSLKDKQTHPFNPRRCSYAAEALPQAWLGFTAMSMMKGPKTTNVTEKEYIDGFITEVIAHEMGHILGLRHNFIASTLHSMKDLANGDRVRSQGVVSSVMDYNPFNQMALHSPDSIYWTTMVGQYDQWAIEYGYTPIDGAVTDDEKTRLKEIASRCNRPGNAYQSDEIADQFDPLVTRFDLGKDPLEYWWLTFRDLNALLKELPKSVPEKGENYWRFTRYFNGMLNYYGRSALVVSRYVGGLHIKGNHRGDPGEKPPLVPVSAADQTRALRLLRQYIFSRDAFNFPKDVYLKLAPNPYPNLIDAITGNLVQDAPIRDSISRIQQQVLRELFDPETLRRMANNEFKVTAAKDTLGLPTLFDTVTEAVWEETKTRSAVNSLRRPLQRAYLKTMTDMLINPSHSAPDDAKMLARHHLRQLKAKLQSGRAAVKDEYTRVHYSEALDIITRALDAKFVITNQQPVALPNLLRLLGDRQ